MNSVVRLVVSNLIVLYHFTCPEKLSNEAVEKTVCFICAPRKLVVLLKTCFLLRLHNNGKFVQELLVFILAFENQVLCLFIKILGLCSGVKKIDPFVEISDFL